MKLKLLARSDGTVKGFRAPRLTAAFSKLLRFGLFVPLSDYLPIYLFMPNDTYMESPSEGRTESEREKATTRKVICNEYYSIWAEEIIWRLVRGMKS